jgi:hypothetical protein
MQVCRRALEGVIHQICLRLTLNMMECPFVVRVKFYFAVYFPEKTVR